jgi:hypothetical protein
MSVRIERAAAESESATDWLSHTGHFMVAATARTRSSVVRGEPSSTAFRTSATSTSATMTSQLHRRNRGDVTTRPLRRTR